MKKIGLLILLAIHFFQLSLAQTSTEKSTVDVLHYQVQLTPNFNTKTIGGKVIIHFSIPPSTKKISLDCGQLTVNNVEGAAIKKFQQQNKKLTLTLSDSISHVNEIAITYQGKPNRGLVFNGSTELYTVFFTSEWMVCHDQPHDKATVKMELILPSSLNCIASGELKKQAIMEDNLTKHTWLQVTPSPTYTYGFVAGKFNQAQADYCGTSLPYYAPNFSSAQLDTIFQYTPAMLAFFEEKSGIPYFQNTYAQALIGNHYQEMAGCSVLKNAYGSMILKDSTETNLISHELAHQWWGNQITCENWGHFWLNEGFATFMSAAFNEHRFGQEKYQSDIDAYYGVYKKIKDKGKDRSLVFKNWLNPSTDDRNLVYFKGAYVLHLLRIELGEADFWKGIQYFSLQYFGKSVNTQQFQAAMEEATNKDLQAFFDKWVY
ncbi:MAG: M1 family metallopeptidase [Bacteroidota bacterium]